MDIFLVGIFGLIVGSFLNVYICRMHTGKSLGGRSHCLSCGTTLVWYELLPALSYLLLGGRCRHCTSRISARYFFVEVSTALLFIFSYFLTGGVMFHTMVLFFISALLVVIVTYDMMHTIIPDELVIALILASIISLLSTDVSLLPHIVAGIASAIFFWFFWYISNGQWMGLGDAKLAFPLGMLAGGWGAMSMITLAFWIGAIVSLSILLMQKGKTHMPFLPRNLTMKSEIPFAPFLVLGFVCVHFFHVDIFTITDVVIQSLSGY